MITAGAQFADYHLMRRYFEDPSLWAPGVVWTPTQIAAVEGHISMVNSIVADELLFKAALNPENDCAGSVDTVPGDRRTRYDSETNPGGVRCSVLDIMKNMIGVRPKSAWGPQEKEVGEGFAGLPFGNIGIQYGLEPLRRGEITAQQFVDLNAKLGGLDVDLREHPRPHHRRHRVDRSRLPHRPDQRGPAHGPGRDHQLRRPRPGHRPRLRPRLLGRGPDGAGAGWEHTQPGHVVRRRRR